MTFDHDSRLTSRELNGNRPALFGRVLLRALWRRSRQGDRQIDKGEDDPEVPEGSPNESLSGKGVSGASGETRTLKVLPP